MGDQQEHDTNHTAGRWSALFFIAQFVFIWTTFLILSSAVGWPASLNDPAREALPRLLANRSAVLIGYSCYLLAALLIIPAVAAFNARFAVNSTVAGLGLALAAVSAMAKTIGISRWLFAMPALATSYVEPGANTALIATLFSTLNEYAGGIGEIIGVGLVGGLLTLLLGWSVFRLGGLLPKVVGGFAILAGLLLFANLPAGFGVEMGGILTLSNIVWQFALLGLGLYSLTKTRASSSSAR